MEQIILQNNDCGFLAVHVVAGRIQIALDGRTVYTCSEEQSQDIVRFLKEQFKDKESPNADR